MGLMGGMAALRRGEIGDHGERNSSTLSCGSESGSVGGSQVYSATGSTEYILTEDLKEATVEIVCFQNCSSTIIEKKIHSCASINRCVCGMLDRWTKRCFQLKIHQLEELSSDKWR